MNKIRKNDEVVVIAGKDKGKRGKVVRRIDAEYVIVDGINLVKKAVKPNPLLGSQGGIVEKSMPLHVSNLAIFNAVTGAPDLVGFSLVGEKKVRVFKSNGEVIKV